jgi:aminoglycoside phosphotransferase (APT) family kinase protein
MAAPDDLEELRGPLAGWLRDRLQTDRIEVMGLARPGGGQSNDTVLFEAAWDDHRLPRRQALVLRRQQIGDHIFRTPDVLREHRVLEGLAPSWVPVPRTRWAEPDASVLGAPFFVMDLVAGLVPLAKPSIHTAGWLPTLTTSERTRLCCSALDALVAIHAVDWRTRHSFLLDGGDAAQTLVAHVERIAGWYEWAAAGREFPITDAARDEVVRRAASVPVEQPVLVWGDARVGNMIFAADHRVAAVLDWEVATIGSAAIDVAHWLFFDRFATEAIGVEPLPGWPDRDATIARYEERAGRSLPDLDLFEMLEELFVATTLIRQADARVACGLARPDTRMGHDNTVTQMLARRLGLPVPELSPDYLAHRGMKR